MEALFRKVVLEGDRKVKRIGEDLGGRGEGRPKRKGRDDAR